MSYAQSAKNLTGYQKDLALGQAIAATVVLVIQFLDQPAHRLHHRHHHGRPYRHHAAALASTGIGLLLEAVVFAIVYLIAALITGDWNPLDTYTNGRMDCGSHHPGRFAGLRGRRYQSSGERQ